MKICEKIISLALIAALLVPGLPLLPKEDVSRDSRVDLKDAILLVKDFSGKAEGPAGFRESYKNLISALRVTAGMKTVIKSSDETKAGNGAAGVDLTCLRHISTLAEWSECSFYWNEIPSNFQSIITTPSSPPPQFS